MPMPKAIVATHDQAVFALEPHLDLTSVFGVHATVVMARDMPRFAQRLGQCFGLGARCAVNDAGLPLARSGKAQDLAAWGILDGKGQMDVGPIEPAQEGFRRDAIEQPGDNLGPRFLVRCGGKGGQGHAKGAAQFPIRR